MFKKKYEKKFHILIKINVYFEWVHLEIDDQLHRNHARFICLINELNFIKLTNKKIYFFLFLNQ